MSERVEGALMMLFAAGIIAKIGGWAFVGVSWAWFALAVALGIIGWLLGMISSAYSNI